MQELITVSYKCGPFLTVPYFRHSQRRRTGARDLRDPQHLHRGVPRYPRTLEGSALSSPRKSRFREGRGLVSQYPFSVLYVSDGEKWAEIKRFRSGHTIQVVSAPVFLNSLPHAEER